MSLPAQPKVAVAVSRSLAKVEYIHLSFGSVDASAALETVHLATGTMLEIVVPPVGQRQV